MTLNVTLGPCLLTTRKDVALTNATRGRRRRYYDLNCSSVMMIGGIGEPALVSGVSEPDRKSVV